VEPTSRTAITPVFRVLFEAEASEQELTLDRMLAPDITVRWISQAPYGIELSRLETPQVDYSSAPGTEMVSSQLEEMLMPLRGR
jgi:hypothetical protein